MMDYLRDFYEIIGECGQARPPYEVWREWATDNADFWPIGAGAKLIGGVLFKGHTVHIAVLPQWQKRWIKPSHLRAWRQFPHTVDLYATPLASNVAACRMAEALGFRLATEGEADAFSPLRHVTGLGSGRTIYVKPRNVHAEESCPQL